MFHGNQNRSQSLIEAGGFPSYETSYFSIIRYLIYSSVTIYVHASLFECGRSKQSSSDADYFCEPCRAYHLFESLQALGGVRTR